MEGNGHAGIAGTDDSRSARPAEELSLIWRLLGRQIAFHRRLVYLTGSAKAALLLSQAIYWTRHGRDVVQHGGWFYKTIGQWKMETGLSEKEQASARQNLRALAILDERRAGVPAKLHFRLALEQLGTLLTDRAGMSNSHVDWDDGALVAELLGPTLSFHRTLAAVAGGVNAGLMLSRAVHVTRRQSGKQFDGWICGSAALWNQETGLTRRQQETARRDLALLDVWEETVSGIPPRTFARVKLACLLTRLAEYVHTSPEITCGARAPAAPVCGISADRFAQSGETGLREPGILVSPKAPNQFRRERHHTSAESATSHIRRSTTTSVQPLHHDARTDRGNVPDPGSGGLIFPDRLTSEEKSGAHALVTRCPTLAQALLDELEARMRANAVRTSPIAYLRGMIRRAEAGTFVSELGLQVAAARRRRHEEALARVQREEEERRLAAERASPDYQAKVAERRAKIRGMLDAMRHKERKTP